MKTIRLTDTGYSLLVQDEAPPVPEGATPRPERASNEVAQFFKKWKQWAKNYGLEFHPEGEDYQTARRLFSKYGKEELERRAREFWLQESHPLVAGEYRHHMRLFAAKMETL